MPVTITNLTTNHVAVPIVDRTLQPREVRRFEYTEYDAMYNNTVVRHLINSEVISIAPDVSVLVPPHAYTHEAGGTDVIQHQNLQGTGTYTHTQIDTYLSAVNTFSTVTEDIDFSSSASEDVTIAIGSQVRGVVRGRLYIDEDPGSAFAAWSTCTFYSKSAKHGADAFYRMISKLVYTELEVATTGSDANITPDDQTDFSPNDLAYIIDGGSSEFVRLATIADTMVAEDTVGAHAIDTGLVRVAEFSGFDLLNNESGTDVYFRVAFAAVQTVSLKVELLLRN